MAIVNSYVNGNKTADLVEVDTYQHAWDLAVATVATFAASFYDAAPEEEYRKHFGYLKAAVNADHSGPGEIDLGLGDKIVIV